MRLSFIDVNGEEEEIGEVSSLEAAIQEVKEFFELEFDQQDIPIDRLYVTESEDDDQSTEVHLISNVFGDLSEFFVRIYK